MGIRSLKKLWINYELVCTIQAYWPNSLVCTDLNQCGDRRWRRIVSPLLQTNHLKQEVFWGNWAVEAREVAEATKVNLVIWVPGLIQPSGSAKNLMKWGCRGHWGYWGCWGCWGHWGCRCSKDWKITTEDFRVIQVLEFCFILMFWKKNVWWNHEKYYVES